MAMALPTIRLGPKWKLVLGAVTLWAVQAFYVWAVHGKFLTPQEWATWWFDRIAEVARWVDYQWRTRGTGK